MFLKQKCLKEILGKQCQETCFESRNLCLHYRGHMTMVQIVIYVYTDDGYLQIKTYIMLVKIM